ncbi:hypothetical protein [Paraburkholderia hayleyella]|uniref:hypothetical protein n=1 Tax=Paraburkholderia hayleyella TaxID=2152889 RepID=UPI001580E3F1|nr:hypothetical protein [Paraburkholderia hayleyella]
MLHSLFAKGPQLSEGVSRAFATAAVLGYLALFAAGSAVLPEFIFRDADKIQAQIGGSNSYEGSTFDTVGKFYGALGDVGTKVFVGSIGAVFVWMMLRMTRRVGALAICIVLLGVCVFFNLFVASKDTLVVLISIVIARTAHRFSWHQATITAIVLYGAYAAIVRSYYALILAIAIVAFVFRLGGARMKLLLLIAIPVAVFLLPDTVYYALGSPRDAAVDYLIYGSPFGARTAFYNPFPPDSFVNFSANYLYSLARLNMPIVFEAGVKEFGLQAFIWTALWAALHARSRAERRALQRYDMLACLLIGHAAVSMLFEPDLGSYPRHLSSVALFSATLLAVQTAYAERVAMRGKNVRDTPAPQAAIH